MKLCLYYQDWRFLILYTCSNFSWIPFMGLVKPGRRNNILSLVSYTAVFGSIFTQQEHETNCIGYYFLHTSAPLKYVDSFTRLKRTHPIAMEFNCCQIHVRKLGVVHRGSPWTGSTKRSIGLVHRCMVHFLYTSAYVRWRREVSITFFDRIVLFTGFCILGLIWRLHVLGRIQLTTPEIP